MVYYLIITGDDGEIDPWWRVDLEEEHCIGMITVINRVVLLQ